MLEENETCDKKNDASFSKYLENILIRTFVLVSFMLMLMLMSSLLSFDEMSCALHRQQRVLRARGSEARLRGFSLLLFFFGFCFSMIFFS